MKRKKDRMTNILDLDQFINYDAREMDKETSLPLCHTTSETNLGKILKSKTLKSAIPCKIFNEKLIFFFYGKAEYMPRKDDKDEMKPYSPVTFLYKLDSIETTPKRMLPFDSGGVDLYDLELKIEDFIVNQPTEAKIKSYVQKVFGTKKQYFVPTVVVNTDDYPLLYPIKEVKRMFDTYRNNAKFSHRAFTLEVQYPDDDDMEFVFNPYRVYLPYKLYTAIKKKKELELYFPGIEVDYYGKGSEMDIGGKYREMRHKVKSYIMKTYC